MPGQNKRKDRVTVFTVETPAPAGLPPEKQDAWFLCVAEIERGIWGAENYIDGHIDRDEEHEYMHPVTREMVTSRIHMVSCIFPVDKDGKLVAKNATRRANINRLNKAVEEMSVDEFGVHFMTGSKLKSTETVDELKAKSERAELEAMAEKMDEAACMLDDANAVRQMRKDRDAAQAQRDSAKEHRDKADMEADNAERRRDSANLEASAAEAKAAKAQSAIDEMDKNLDEALAVFDALDRGKAEKAKLEKERDELKKGNDELRAEHARIAASPPEVKVTVFDADPETMLPNILEAAADWYTERSRQQDGKAKQCSETMATLFREVVGDLQKTNRNGETLLSCMMQFVRARLLKRQGES